MDIDKFQAMLAEMLDELPEPFFEELHGGVIVSPRCKENPHSRGGDLYILGEYHRSHAMGNQIVIYYGSFMRLYGKAAEQTFERELRAVLRHEFRHHMENRAGERGLEIEDERQLREYLEMRACRVYLRYKDGKFAGIRRQ
ncbi:MAG TPA: metallopeptidase family protein [Candidatus Alectryocaccomicrobium excrementavium]|uniref:Metallopeptidase family protein n=1 Tax=Candidatus Alectryocaccomicrobium excrementavium TaxID=2840668 RepID=A0A9D1FY88_9FIRM|nr:metallopeptidase family protein [Candidatus Alectryocaccomicrobium excrementavium]